MPERGVSLVAAIVLVDGVNVVVTLSGEEREIGEVLEFCVVEVFRAKVRVELKSLAGTSWQSAERLVSHHLWLHFPQRLGNTQGPSELVNVSFQLVMSFNDNLVPKAAPNVGCTT